jgi:hypothetical protein
MLYHLGCANLEMLLAQLQWPYNVFDHLAPPVFARIVPFDEAPLYRGFEFWAILIANVV